MSHGRTYSDAQLEAAVAESRSWRGVLRALGLAATSSSAIRSVRRQADRLGLDHSHFTGHRRWSDEQLAAAIRGSTSWTDVVRAVGLADTSSRTALKGHAVRLGLVTDHLEPREPSRPHGLPMAIDLANLPRAGSLLAASWFSLCGYDVSWPLEPCRYDLLVVKQRSVRRIQVKTATVATAGGSWTAWLSTTRGGRRSAYDPDDIDDFFVIDGDLGYYLLPINRVGGLHAVVLAAYEDCRVN